MTKNDFAIDYSNRLVVAAIAIPRECAQLASLFTLETVSENRMGEQLLDYYASNSMLKYSVKQLPRKNLRASLGPNRSCWIGKSSRFLSTH